MSKEKLTSLHTAGPLRKLQVQLKSDNLADYQLPVGEQLLPLNPLLGQKNTLHAMNKIQCIHCGRITIKVLTRGTVIPVLPVWHSVICASLSLNYVTIIKEPVGNLSGGNNSVCSGILSIWLTVPVLK